jgi:UPF0176 protein
VRLPVAAFYRFAPLEPEGLPALRAELLALGRAEEVKGTVLLAEEGVNGTVCGPEAGVRALLDRLRGEPSLAELEPKWSWSEGQGFHRLKVRIKPEIVSLGRPEAQPARRTGTAVPPEEWNSLLDDPATLVIDTRNAYEVAVGSFKGAIDPATSRFRAFPEWVERRLEPLVAERRPEALALFCTGGIRCEKATAYLLERGFEAVHQLQGGILNYLARVPPERSRWRGECFVFDQRVALNHRLEPGSHSLCHACRMPLSPAERALPSYVEGVSCRHCFGGLSGERRRRLAERQRQMALAAHRGEAHLGREFPV